MKDALMKYETIDALQIDDLMERRDVRPPRDAHDSKPEKKEAQPKVEEKPESKAEEPQMIMAMTVHQIQSLMINHNIR